MTTDKPPYDGSFYATTPNTQILPPSGRYALKQPFIITCSNCKMAFRTENLTPYMMARRKWFCPACGLQTTNVKSNYDDDRWYAMARTFNLQPNQETVIMLKEIYKLWDPSEYEWFKDFVQYMITEAIKVASTGGEEGVIDDNDN